MQHKTHDKPPSVESLDTIHVKTAQKTNAARLLDQMAIHYELREYEVDPDDLAAETVAAKIGLPPKQVFKTLVARGDRNGIVMAWGPRQTDVYPQERGAT